MATIAQLQNYLSDPRVRAFLDMTSAAEGADYDTLVNRGSFNHAITDLSQHPNINVHGSTAAGRYQFLYSTWAGLQSQLGLPDFSPGSQDIAAVELMRECGALNKVLNDDLQGAIYAANRIWASFPGSPYGQGTRTMNFMLDAYNSAAGVVSSVVQTAQDAGQAIADYSNDAANVIVDTATNPGVEGGFLGIAAIGLGVLLLLSRR